MAGEVLREEFNVHMLNDLEEHCGKDGGREMAVVRTKLQEAAFFAKRAIAMRPENQEPLVPADK